MMDTFEALVREQARRRAAAIERAIEEALQGGEHGVLVDDQDCWAVPHVSVPYGEVHYLPPRGGLHFPDW